MVVKKSTVVRFERKFHKSESGCWLWDAGLTDGYGRFWFQRKLLNAHQFSYMVYVGPVPKGKQLDHLCRIRHCVNPAHLEPVTVQENLFRGKTLAASNKAKTHCSNGHEFTPENTYLYTGRGSVERQCRECGRIKCRNRKVG